VQLTGGLDQEHRGHDLSGPTSRGTSWAWRDFLRPAGTRWNTVARRVFVVAGLMVLSGIMLGVASMLLSLESAEWVFVILFWTGIMLSVPALLAILLTARRVTDKP